ncbi:MAG: prolyl oligopeptidase family serine peptidase [Planctomycetaceae bacterium]|nr:prolyl oligopeptidase family serine peptidase [Planctomycetaceae bacterium]
MSHPAASVTSPIARRQLLQWGTAAAVGVPWANRLWAQPAPSTLPPLHRYGRMVHEFYDEQVRSAQAVGLARQAALRSRADAENYVKFVQDQIHEAFEPWPEKTPLKPRVSGIVDRDQYTIEKVTFESRPEFFVTANLYVPKGRKFPLPGVVGSCGHSANGKAAGPYQSFAQGLARQGYVVLIFDPIGQGERFQYPNEELTKSTVGAGVLEHLHGGNQQFLVGEFFSSWRAWDGIRALDYLLSRSEVDPQHVGITGNSGGGTMTMWLCGVERRWTMAAPSCAVTTFRRNFQNELPTDTEQCPPKVLAFGLEHGDFLAAMAPKPVIIMSQEKDYFDTRGSAETYERLRSLYRLLGAEQNVQLHVGPDPHGYSQPNREAMYGFFNQQTKIAEGHQEPDLVIEKDETLWVMPRGQVAEIKSRTVLDFTRDKSTALAAARPYHDAASLSKLLPSLLKLPEPIATPPEYRILRGASGRQYPMKFHTEYAVATEPGIEALVTRLSPQSHISRPTRGAEQCTLYVAHHSSDVELRTETWLADLVKADPAVPFYACDVRGIGESKPDTCGGAATFLSPYGCDYFYAAHGVMLDRPYPGQRTWDVLRTLDWLTSVGHRSIHLVALQWGAIPATFAAVLHPAVTKVTLKHALTSYQAVAESEDYDWPLSSFVPGILSTCDLPDCYRALAVKGLTQIEPYGPDAGRGA